MRGMVVVQRQEVRPEKICWDMSTKEDRYVQLSWLLLAAAAPSKASLRAIHQKRGSKSAMVNSFSLNPSRMSRVLEVQ